MELEGLLLSHKHPSVQEMALLFREGKEKEAITLLEKLLGENKPVPAAENDLQGLKTSGMLLETRLSVLIHKKAELLKQLSQFRVQYHAEVETIMSEILRLRREILFRKAEKNSVYEQELKQSKEDYDSFHNQQQQEKENLPKHSISREQKELIREKFRTASKLCHPDLIAEELREQAAAIFIRLRKAYMNNDIDEVDSILELLQKSENRLAGRTESVTEVQRLRSLLEKLRQECNELESEIIQIQDSRAYKTLMEIDELDQYFDILKKRLQEELQNLQEEYEQSRIPSSEE